MTVEQRTKAKINKKNKITHHSFLSFFFYLEGFSADKSVVLRARWRLRLVGCPRGTMG